MEFWYFAIGLLIFTIGILSYVIYKKSKILPQPHAEIRIDEEKQRYLILLENQIKELEEQIEINRNTIAVQRTDLKTLLERIVETKSQNRLLEAHKEEYESYIEKLQHEIFAAELEKEEKETELNNLVNKVQNIIDEQKRKAMEDEFYRVNVSTSSQTKIKTILEFAAKYPEIKGAITSAVYSHYYATEVASMCNRVLGERRKVTGIYKITNTINGLVYVGKSVDIRNRWTQHIRRAVGVERETQNLLYPAMREFEVWNFSFEVLEECEQDQLSEREKFYQSVYKAKEDYSIR